MRFHFACSAETCSAGASQATTNEVHPDPPTGNALPPQARFSSAWVSSSTVLRFSRFAVAISMARWLDHPMTRCIRRLGFLCTLLFSFAASAQSSWTPGRFGELVTGQSKVKDVLRVLGPAEPKQGKRLTTYTYPGKGDFGGGLIVEVSNTTKVIEVITSRPAQNITRTEAYRKFGKDYREVTYAAAKCGEGTNPPVYRDKNGAVELIEYPTQGIVLWPNRYGFDIAAIVYLARPLPTSKPKCPK